MKYTASKFTYALILRISKMNKGISLRVFGYVLLRTFQVMVAMPAVFVAVVLLGSALAGEQPVRSLLQSLYEYAETSVRPAESGYVFSRTCVERHPPTETFSAPDPVCKEFVAQQIPIDMAIADVIRTLKQLYFFLILCSFAFLYMFKPGKRFIGLEESEAGASTVGAHS
jgi:hypothetical protein